MTKKDFLLVIDCIDKAMERLFTTNTKFRDAMNDEIANKVPAGSCNRLEHQLRNAFALEFAERLKYTNDNFDTEKFVDAVLPRGFGRTTFVAEKIKAAKMLKEITEERKETKPEPHDSDIQVSMGQTS